MDLLDLETQEPILVMKNASLDFGNGVGVFNLTFSLPRGIILGMIGPSGCGKTTTVRMLTGIYRPTSGEALVFGKPPSTFNDEEKHRLGYLPQQFILYAYLSTEENLNFMGGMYGMSFLERKKRIEPLLEFVELTDARKRLGGQLSGGMKRRLMLAGALLHDPELIFADEPTAGIDPILRARIWQNFRQLRDQGHTLVVTTQYVGEAAFCDLVIVMRRGRLIALDTPEGLRRRALGGEAITIHVDPDHLFRVMEFLNGLPQVHKVEQAEGERAGMRVFVEDTGRELPALLASLREALDITPYKAEPYRPPFDDVFVRLVQQAEDPE